MRIDIEPPQSYIPLPEMKTESLQWVFKGYSEERLAALWDAAGLSPAQRAALDSPARRMRVGGRIVLSPDPQVVLELAPAARRTIYTALAEFPENHSQREPFRMRADAAATWFNDSGLPTDIVALAQRLLYERDGNLFFSDEDLVLPRLQSKADRIRLLKTLSRKSALLVQIRVEEHADVEGLAAYWGRTHRAKDVRPLLLSLARRPGGGRIDLAHLLPRLPRALLYTYPMVSANPIDAAHDCHWTSLNFFNDEPDERFAHIEEVKRTLLRDYVPVTDEPRFGDVMVLVQPDGVVVHSCVYLAAGVVFTKNGAAFSVPWLLGKLDAVAAFYSIGPPLETRCFRLREDW